VAKFAITGANGQLGRAAIRHLLNMGVSPGQIVGIVRSEEKGAELRKLGVETRIGDYDRPDTLAPAFAGAEKLLFISASSFDNTLRIRQHACVVEAARNAGVRHIVYTGLAFTEKMNLGLENVHLATEYMIKTTGAPYTFLRNGFYLDMLVNPGLKQIVESGSIVTSAPTGAMNYVTRDNLALAAAKVLTGDGHENRTYELTAPEPFTYDQFADLLSEISGKTVRHRALSPEEALRAMTEAGTPPEMAGFMVHGVFKAIEEGRFGYASRDLTDLIGDAYTTLRAAVSAVL